MWLAGHSDWQYLKGFWNIWNSNDKTKKRKNYKLKNRLQNGPLMPLVVTNSWTGDGMEVVSPTVVMDVMDSHS